MQDRVLYDSILELGQGDNTDTPFSTVTSAFFHHARSCPDATALRELTDSPRELTYRDLAKRAQELAAHLIDQGVCPGSRVPLVAKRGIDMVVGILAILSCGAQYVPLDGKVVPDETIRRVLGESEGGVVLCLTSTKHRVASHLGHVVVVIDEVETPTLGENAHIDLASPEAGCYVIYTSGTTGEPKGVDITHKNVTNLVCLSPGNLGVAAGTCVGSVLNISFDMAAWEIFVCLCNGGTLVLRGSNWDSTLQQIDVLICTPTILSKYHPTQFPRIKTVATAGEPTTRRLADLWAEHGTYWNCCGPTETTIVNTMHKHTVGKELSIGRPTPNNRVYILDGEGKPTPMTNVGVMWAGGLGVSRGYIGLDDKTAERYKPDPFAKDGSMIYNTGDLGRWRPDGSIEFLGRVDDQVKVKVRRNFKVYLRPNLTLSEGFRVELDGVTASLMSAPGVSQAAALLIDGEIHGFTTPRSCDVTTTIKHIQQYQPYYAVPTHLHLLDEFPSTPNGKVDKNRLRVLAFAEQSTTTQPWENEKLQDSRAELKQQPSMSTLATLTEKLDLERGMPDKTMARPLRGLRHRIFIVYRTLFSLIGLLNLAALICVIALHLDSEWLGIITAINLAVAVLVRQETIINILYAVFCSVPKSLPLWVRVRCAKIYHLGGVHSGAGVCATAWLVISTVRGTICNAGFCKHHATVSLATQIVSWILCGLLCSMVATAWPSFRKQHHDLFERFHRFAGWTSLSLFWARTILAINDTRPRDQDLGLAAVKTPEFWLLIVATFSIASSWFFLRKVPVEAEVLSDHAVRLHFDYTVPVNGSFTRISQRPLIEWHSFATIPNPEANRYAKGHSLVVSNAGDWTRSCIQNPPSTIWVRGVPTCGVMRISTLFNRVVVIATGSGIGPLLGHIVKRPCPTQLIWSTTRPETTFGEELVGQVRDAIPDAVIWDTKAQGRPDLVRMGYNMAKNFDAEAVIIIANEKITKKVVYGLETRGMPAFGAIWDNKKKSPIVFLHGLFGSKKNNRAISKALARDLGRYVYALDLRNHGESPHDTQHDYNVMAQDVAEFIEGHGLKDTTLIGHSMGAKASMALALRSPDLVSDIVAVDNAPVDVSLSRDFPKYVRAMKKIQEAGVTRQSEADKILSEYEESLPIRQFLLGNMYLPEGEKVRKFRIPLNTLGKALDNLGDFPYKNPNEIRFEKPALFVRGTQSKYVPDDVLPLIGQFFPKFRLVDIDAGHWLISEQPEAFRQAVVEFLQQPE
ncbi:non-ribosomal peptide synthetase [Fusarium longipes]|uniref:Non-ribosomal peptide synthetase n=1 Tax=Fusarium longipes TaxID=694270 RepID=A0A395SGW7_9HYPO|nr:non-ribosomal peptide synthetase [Fusarium longipes]